MPKLPILRALAGAAQRGLAGQLPAGRRVRPWIAFGFAALALAAILSATYGALSTRGEAKARADAARLTAAVAAGLADQTSRALQAADLLLIEATSHLGDAGAAPLTAEMAALAQQLPPIRALFLANERGRITAATVPGMEGRSIGGTAWFDGLATAPAGEALLPGRPEPGRLLDAPGMAIAAARRWSLPVARPVHGPAGEFQGAAVVLLNPDYLTGMSRRVAKTFGLAVRFYSFDGVLLARSDGGTEGIGTPFPEAWPFRGEPPRTDAGSFAGRDGATGGQVVASFAVTRTLPLVVEVSQPMAAVLEPARQQGRALELAGLAVALVALAGLAAQLWLGHRLAASERAAREATRAKDRFLASMSREIGTPVNAMIGTAGLLLETPLQQAQRRHVESILGSARQLMTVLNDVLHFSRLGAGERERQPYALEQELAIILELLGPGAAARGVELVCSIEPGVPERITGDAAALRQVLFNLVGNAVKFTEAGWIRLSVGRVGGSLVLSVADTGPGIDPARIEELFEPFAGGHEGAPRRRGGSGLGLAIARRLAFSMGGRIEAAPRPGGGSVFSLHLPLEADLPAPVPERSWEGRRALAVDELPLSRKVLAQQLGRLGFSVEPVEDAASVPDRLRTAIAAGRAVDLVVLNGRAPGLVYIGAAERVRAEHGAAAPRLVFCNPGVAVAPGLMDAVLQKPVLPSRLREAVRRAMASAAEPAPVGAGETAAPRRRSGEALLAHPAELPLPPVRQARAPRVLLADDHPVNQFVLNKALLRAGCEVALAGDGASALAMAGEAAFDAVLLGVHLPELDGPEIARRLRAGDGPSAGARIIGLAASAGREQEERCREAGMDMLLAKPVDPEAVLRAIGRPA